MFVDRLSHLVRRDGLEGVGGSYGVRPQTVANWLRSRSSPSAARRRSVVERGLRISGASRTVRNPATGRFEQSIVSGHAVKAITTINRQRLENMQSDLDAATNERQRDMARAGGVPLTLTEERALDIKLRDLNKRTALYGSRPGSREAQQLEFDWRRFNRDYDALASNQPVDPLGEMLDEDIEQETTETPQVSYIRYAYLVLQGRTRRVFKGARGGLYYLSPSGYRVYVKEARVYEASRAISEST